MIDFTDTLIRTTIGITAWPGTCWTRISHRARALNSYHYFENHHENFLFASQKSQLFFRFLALIGKNLFYRKSSVIYIAGAIIEARIGLTRTLFDFQYLFSKFWKQEKFWGYLIYEFLLKTITYLAVGARIAIWAVTLVPGWSSVRFNLTIGAILAGVIRARSYFTIQTLNCSKLF